MAAAQPRSGSVGAINDGRTVLSGNNAQSVPQDQVTMTESDSQVRIRSPAFCMVPLEWMLSPHVSSSSSTLLLLWSSRVRLSRTNSFRYALPAYVPTK